MRKGMKRQVNELYAGAARFSGAVVALVAAWFTILAVRDMLSGDPFGGELLGAVVLGLMATVLITARAEKPRKSHGRDRN